MNEWKQLVISPTTRAAVLRMIKARGDEGGLSAIVEEAMLAWLEKAARETPSAAQAAACGYQWKSLFLPAGTCVRFEYRHETYHAEVRGDHLVYMGRRYSPRQLLLHVTGTVRNAWRELWILAPGDFRWHLADTRRRILRRAPRDEQARARAAGDRGGPCGSGATGPRGPGKASTSDHCARARDAGEPAGAGDSDSASSDSGSGAVLLQRWANAGRAAARAAILYRDDQVRADQPDLTCPLGRGGPAGAGRAGPRDRRYHGYIGEMLATARTVRPGAT